MPTPEQLQKLIAPLFPGLMGVEIAEATPERIVATLLVRPELCTSGGVCHGGAYMAFADELGGLAAGLNLPPGMGTTTIESKTNFLRASLPGRLTAEAVPVHVGDRAILVQTTIYRPDGKPAAVVTQTQLVLPRDHKPPTPGPVI